MRKNYLATIFFVALFTVSYAQVTYTWVGGASGDYQSSANWSPLRTLPATTDILAFNAISAITVNNVSNESIGAIQIASGTNAVSFATNSFANILKLTSPVPLIYSTAGSILSADYLAINLTNSGPFTLNTGVFGIAAGTGGKIIINSALTLNGGVLDFDEPGTGGTTITGSVTYISGIFTCVNSNAITWSGSSNYYHALSGSGVSTIPISSWQTNSTCNIIGMNVGAIAPTGLNENNFSNFTWDCTSQFADIELNWVTGNIGGTFSIKNTNNKSIHLSGAAGGVITAGAYAQTGGNIMLQSSSGNISLIIAGNFLHAGGILDAVGGSAAGSATLDLKGGVTKSAIWQCSSSNAGTLVNIQFSGTLVQPVSITGTWTAPVAGRSNITINNSNLITGVNLTLNSVLKVFSNASSPATLTMAGIITPADASAYVSYVGNGTLLYAGSFSQTASAVEFPSVNGPANLTINNSLGTKFPANFNRILSGTLTMLNGNLAIDDFSTGNKLELTNTSLATQLNYTNGFITTGKLGRYFPVSGLPTTLVNGSRFPFGTGVNDRSLNIYFSAATLSTGTAGIIYVSHRPVGGVTAIAPTVTDNGVNLDKKSNTYWAITTGAFSVGSGLETISLATTAANIGSVDNYTTLRLTDGGTSAYGTSLMPNPNTGSNSIPVTGKTGLKMTDLSKNLYIASDGTNVYNPLINITFNWNGSTSTDWTNPANWAGLYAVGYPSASTEIAIIDNSLSPTFWPTINTGTSVSLYQLTVNSGISLTMAPASSLNVYDNVNFSGGSTYFSPTSTFGYASSSSAQNIQSLTYGNLSISGTAAKTLPLTLTVTGDYSVSGSSPVIGTNTFIYAGAGSQRIAVANYYNLSITGNRSGGTITMGNPPTPGVIDIANNFDVSGLSNNIYPGFVPLSFTNINFSSTGSQTIPGFYYPASIKNTGNGPRILDNTGSTDANHVIYCRAFSSGLGAYTNIGSKVNFYVTGFNDVKYTFPLNFKFNDLEFSGDLKNYTFDFFEGPFYVAGKFIVSLTNYKQPTNNVTTFVYNGTGDQTIYAYKTNGNTPSFKYPNIVVQGLNRNITLAGSNTDTINISGSLQVPRTGPYNADFGYYGYNLDTKPFTAGKGFIVNGSTVNFNYSSSLVPLLIPSSSGTYNYNNVVVSSGTHSLESDMTIGGNLSVTGIDASNAILNIGDGNSNRILNVLGNMAISNTGTGLRQIDMNNGTNGSTKINLAGNLAISGNAQIMGTTSTGTNNGIVLFNGSTPQTYTNTSNTYNNGLVNFVVGNGTTSSYLTLGSTINLLASSTVANKSTLTISNKSSVDCGIYNVVSNGTGNSIFNLNAGASLITANTGGVEGGANTSSNGSIINDATIEKNYDPLASYVFNAIANTNTNFPAVTTPFPMANLTLGNDVNTATFSLNKSIDLSKILTLKNNVTLAIGNNYLNLKSSSNATAIVAPVPNNANITYGSGRFVVERYYPQRRSWRLVTAPITADAGRSVFTSWQQGNAPFTISGSGTFVTGKNASNANGLDVSPLNNSSLKTYNGTTYVDASDTKNLLLSGTGGIAGTPDNIGFFLFVRGDRDPGANLFTIPYMNNTTLRDTGKIQIKDQIFNANGAAGSFALIGNPYASPVDITNIIASSSNVDPNYFWAFDPRINTEQGAYVSMVLVGGVWKAVPSNPLVTQDKNIQSSQAIFVRKLNSSPGILSFHETDKSSQNNLNMFRAASLSSQFATNLYLQQPDTTILADGNLEIFDDNYSAVVDFGDAPKFSNTRETFGLLRDSKTLAIERRPQILAFDTIFFKLTKTSQRNYNFEFIPQNFNPALNAFLEDRYTGLKTPINLTTTSSFNFTINSDTVSAASDRFKIVFKNSLTAGPLPVTFKSIKAYHQNDHIAIEWTVENELNISKYELEKSIDGITFTKIYTTPSKGFNTLSSTYPYLDKNLFAGNNFYRVLSYSQTGGTFEYSRVAVVKINEQTQEINIFPNPVTGNKIGLALNNLPAGKYNLKLINSLGQVMMVQQINNAGGNSLEFLTPDSKLSSGIYQLEVTKPDKSSAKIKVVVQ